MLDILGKKISQIDEEDLKKFFIATASLKKSVLHYKEKPTALHEDIREL
jgi:hypothetical protein